MSGSDREMLEALSYTTGAGGRLPVELLLIERPGDALRLLDYVVDTRTHFLDGRRNVHCGLLIPSSALHYSLSSTTSKKRSISSSVLARFGEILTVFSSGVAKARKTKPCS